MDCYNETVVYSSRELSFMEKARVKTAKGAVLLNDVVEPGQALAIEPAYYVVVHVENPRADVGEYDRTVIVDTGGTRYVTSSTSFLDALRPIFDDVSHAASIGEDVTGWQLEVYKAESKKYKGKYMLLCNLA